MASVKVGDQTSGFAVIQADGEGVPISFPFGSDGIAIVTAIRLSLRFQLNKDSLHIDEEVYDSVNGELSHTIGQLPVCNGDGKHWLLGPGRFRFYGLSNSIMVATTILATPLSSPNYTIQTPLNSRVKVEPGLQPITILSNDSDMSSPLQVTPSKTPSQISPLHDPPCESQGCPNKSFSQSGLKQLKSIVDCLKKLHASKGSRNALKGLDYDVVKLLRMDFLPPIFNGDVVFELPLMGSFVENLQAKLMVGMDKRHDGHAWTKTITSYIKNDMGLMFCTSSCVGHLRCNNKDCEYLSHVHCINPLNETEWDGSTPIPFLVGGQPPSASSILCKICKTPPSCIATCGARIYYVFGRDDMTRACIHLGVHEHPVKDGEYQDFKEWTRTLLGEQVERTPHATNSTIVMEATKELLRELLLAPQGVPAKTMTFEELVPVLDKYKYMTSPSVKNIVTTFRYL
jgi:hypothetical protein